MRGPLRADVILGALRSGEPGDPIFSMLRSVALRSRQLSPAEEWIPETMRKRGPRMTGRRS